ncbi:MAG: ParA family protein [Gammaproteobacteria bacterium]|nr:ParA family protein [Gammaproteobacteria bacterium]MDE2345524.1 ParA family protein [Gammaproteobacteria bacterium]
MLNLKLWQSKPRHVPLDQRAQNPPAMAPRPLLRIVALNTKGGCGKTTLCTNLAGYYASHGYRTALLDADIQGSSLQWLRNRGDKPAAIAAIDGAQRSGRVTRSFQVRAPHATERLIVDTPAALDSFSLKEFTRDADAILIPVLPSAIDIHAVSRCIADLLLVGRVAQHAERVAIVANRVKKHTLIYEKLQHFLQGLNIAFITSLRDTQNYVHAAETGLGIHELIAHKNRQDLRDWDPLIQWLEARPRAASAHGLPEVVSQTAGNHMEG